jgi:hypothetical protein
MRKYCIDCGDPFEAKPKEKICTKCKAEKKSRCSEERINDEVQKDIKKLMAVTKQERLEWERTTAMRKLSRWIENQHFTDEIMEG